MSKTIRVIQTAKETTDRLTEKDPLIFLPDTSGVESELINIYDDLEYQEIEGFGGALTESSAVTIAKLSAAKQKKSSTLIFILSTALDTPFAAHISKAATSH